MSNLVQNRFFLKTDKNYTDGPIPIYLSFATTVTLMNKVPIETVSKMLRHSNIQMTQHYAKILDFKIVEDMAHLRKKFS